jgi:hypothetical protein
MSNFSATLYIITRTSYSWWDDDEAHFVQEEHAELDFYSASWLKQQSVDRHITQLGLIILIPSHNISKTLLNVTYNYHNQFWYLSHKKIGWGQGIRRGVTGYIFPVASVIYCCNVQYEQIISNATRYPQCIIHNVDK